MPWDNRLLKLIHQQLTQDHALETAWTRKLTLPTITRSRPVSIQRDQMELASTPTSDSTLFITSTILITPKECHMDNYLMFKKLNHIAMDYLQLIRYSQLAMPNLR
jgi:hypothetical protein